MVLKTGMRGMRNPAAVNANRLFSLNPARGHELRARFHVGIVAAAVQHADLGARKVPADDLVVPRLDVVGKAARQEANRPFVAIRLTQGIGLQPLQGIREHRQIHQPRPNARLVPLQVGRQELSGARCRHAGLETQFRLGAGTQIPQVELVHRREAGAVRRPEITARRDVHDHEPLHALGLPAREQHGGLPSHAMADESHRTADVRVHPAHHVRLKLVVIHRRIVERASVVPQVGRQDMVPRGQIRAGREPIARRPEHAVQEHERREPGAPEIAVEKVLHA